MRRHDSRAFRALALLSVFVPLLGACELVGSPDEQAPRERRIIVFWDMSRSINADERRRWGEELTGLSHSLGEQLWLEDEFDELLVLPLHANTRTASPLIRQRFSGGELRDNIRRRERQQFAEKLATLDTLTMPLGVIGRTDVLGSIARVEEYTGRDTSRIREIYYLSDMMHSLPPDLDFEAPKTSFTSAAAAAKAGEIVTGEEWSGNTLSEVAIHVRLPGTSAGASSASNNDAARVAAIESFYRSLFGQLGGQFASWER